MDSGIEDYHRELSDAFSVFSSEVDSGHIVGGGASQFLYVTKGTRGVELYRGDADNVIMDPALGEELQGEISFSSYAHACEAALRWLNGCSREELLPESSVQ